MIGLLAIVAIGFLLGMRHATDPDHVIAVTTIVSREGSIKRSALIGAAWGCGHTITILAVGSAIIIFRIALPTRLGLAMELAVGLMLILLGAKNLGGLFRSSVQKAIQRPSDAVVEAAPAYHAHGDYIHVHHHSHGHSHLHDSNQTPVTAMDRWFKGSSLYLWVRPLIVGIVHGLAGSAAVALLVLSTISNTRWAIVYLAVFGLGTILGMMVITIMIGSTVSYGQKRFAQIGSHFVWAAGLISLAFGIFIAYKIGFVDGLFLAHAHWIPS